MDTNIFLNKFDSKNSVSDTSGLNVSLGGKRKLIPSTDASYVISAYEQYEKEREECNIIRLTCEVNPICTNVLFNRVTEIVKDEGSSAVTLINYGFSGSEYSACTDDNENKKPCIFDGVKYKEQSMEFWSANTALYQSVDSTVSTLSHATTLTTAINQSSNYYDNCQCFDEVDSKHPTNAIRDMQLSKADSSGNSFVYHCGLDIFNNHLIRSKTFKPINKFPYTVFNSGCEASPTVSNTPYGAFNTIADVMRDVNGNKVIEKMYFPISAQIDGNTKIIARHVYEFDDVYTFENAVKERLRDKYNGWLGFVNTSKIKSYDDFDSNETLGLERPLMYMNGGDFVDMYPSRDLYSFTPKWNEARQRIEKNWNYCITYPSSSTTDGFEDIIETNNGLNALKAMYFDENTIADNGASQVVIYGVSKHGLSVGDYVNVYRTYTDESGNKVNERIIEEGEVSNIADDYIFTVFGATTRISDSWVEVTQKDLVANRITLDGETYRLGQDKHNYFYKEGATCLGQDDGIHKYYIINAHRGSYGYVNFDEKAQHISYKKVSNGIECDYYVRIFSRLPNFRFASGTTTEYDLYNKDSDMIKTYQDPKYDFESQLSRLAFARNIYSDEAGEIVFTDNIDVSDIKDNLGRPLTSLYLTIVKNNRGYKEWYGFINEPSRWNPNQITNESVEFSHCFGKVTCGFDLSDESAEESSIRNIKSINNHGANGGYNCGSINTDRRYDDLVGGLYSIDEDEVWFYSDINFYGDLSYYDSFYAIENHIQPILHRFNTAQRETSRAASNDYFKSYVYDEIYNDDYDKNDRYIIKSTVVDNVNERKEGYYYPPHYEIPIKTLSTLNSIMPTFLTMRSLINTPNGTRITCLQNHFLGVGDKVMLYYLEEDKCYYCVTTSVINEKVFVCDIYDEKMNKCDVIPDLFSSDANNISKYKLFKLDNLEIPSYAHVIKDGTCRLIWRDVINNGMNSSDKSIETYPFTNGAFYVNKQINLYVRRQDPFGMYGLYSEDDIIGNEMEIEKENNYVKDKEIKC